MGWGSALTLLPPFPADPLDLLDPLDPVDCSKIGLDRLSFSASTALRPDVFSDFFHTASCKSPTFEADFCDKWTLFANGVYTDRQSAVLPRFYSNFATILMEAAISCFEEIGC